MLKIAIKDYLKYFPKILYIVLSFATGIGLFALIVFVGMYLPIKKVDPEIGNTFFNYFFDVLNSTNIDEIFTSDTLQRFIAGLADVLSELSDDLLFKTIFSFILGFGIVLLSRAIGEAITRSSMRKDSANKNSLTGFIAMLVRTAISIIFWAVSFLIVYYWFFALALIPLFHILFSTLKDLVITKIVNFRAYKIRDIVNLKSFFQLTGVNILLKIFNYLLIILILGVTNILVALLIAMPLLSYNACSLTATSTNYFNELIEKRKIRKVN